MKKILLYIVVLTVSLLHASNSVKQDFESNNRPGQMAICWSFPATVFTSNSPISGKYSGYTNQLTSLTSQVGVISPWMKLEPGDITFTTKLSSESGNGTIRRFHIALQNESQTTMDTIYAYNFSLSSEPKPVNVKVPITKTGVYRVFILFSGSGGSGRAHIDDIVLPGVYYADPANSCSTVVTIVDTDKDGVPDATDEYPTDATRAHNTKYPAAGPGTLMFEDLWPYKGDYDFNDLVVDYQLKHVTNAQNYVVETYADFTVRATGGSLNNGFGFTFDNLADSKVKQVTGTILTTSGFSLASNGCEKGQSTATFLVFDNIFKILTHPGVGTGINTDPSAPKVASKTITLHITYSSSTVKLTDISAASFNPFLIINQKRSMEVHLPDMKPTALAGSEFFGTGDDDSQPGSARYYKTKTNLPWALNIPESSPYSVEKVDITSGYLKLIPWVTSGGTQYTDWYKNLSGYREPTKLYTY